MTVPRFPRPQGAPALVLALCLGLAVLQAAGPAAAQLLRYERLAVLDGQLWRLFSAHALHLGWTHLLLNAAGLLLCAALAPQAFQPGRWRQGLARLAWLALAVSVGLLAGSPGVTDYVGLSGVLYGLFLWTLAPQALRGEPAAAVTLVGLLAWAAWQGLAGPLASEEAAIGGHIVAAAHGYGLAGAAAGLGLEGLWRRRARAAGLRHGPAALVAVLHGLVLALVLWGHARSAVPRSAAPQALAVRVVEPATPAPAFERPAPVAPVLVMPALAAVPAPAFELAPETPASTMAPTPARSSAAGAAAPAASSAARPLVPERRGDAPASELPVTPPQADAAHLNNPAPPYPPVSRRMGEQGQVWLDVFVQRDGRVGEVRLQRSSGHPLLDQAALATVRQWRYQPAERGGQPLAVWYLQQVNFVLNP